MCDISKKDVDVLRKLAYRVKELSETRENSDRIELWNQTTELKSDIRPATLVHLWPPVAWGEALPENYQCKNPRAQRYERDMQERIWTIENLKDDSVIEPIIHYEHCVEVIPFKEISEVKEYAVGDEEGKGAAHYHACIKEESDIDKLGDPVINVDFAQREANKQEAEYIFGGILDAIPRSMYFAAKVVDEWVALRGMGQLYMDMIDKPEWTKEAMRRIKDNFIKRFKMLEELGVWGSWDKSDPLGSTGLRFNPNIPNYKEIMEKGSCSLWDSWAFTCAEGFTCVSPQMHTEFSLEYEKELMALFKYVNVGCCEVLSNKIDYVKAIPNVRRVSISEWCDFELAGNEIGKELLYGYKPSGVPFLGDKLNEESVREELHRVLLASKKSPTEIILNIGGTLDRGNPAQKLVRWTEIAREEIDKVYG